MTPRSSRLAAGLVLVLAVAALVLLAGTDVGAIPGMRVVFALVIEVQRTLYGELASAVDALRSGSSAWPLAALFAISFVYGVFHAVGPGHGKVVISSYLVASPGRLRRGLLLAFAASLVQALSAVMLVSLLAVVLKLTRFEVTSQSILLEEGSYGLIVLVGLAMFVSMLWHGFTAGHGTHRHDVPDHAAAKPAGGKRRRRMAGAAAVVLATGVRPCSGAILVLLFALAQGLFAVGVAAAFVMALGTGVTISGLALLAVFSRGAALRIAGESSLWQARIHAGLALASALMVIATGLLFLLASANQSPSL